MSNIANIKKKLAVLETPGFSWVLKDALTIYAEERAKQDVDYNKIENVTEALVLSLKRKYLGELPKKEPKVVQTNLENLIKEIKDGQSKN